MNSLPQIEIVAEGKDMSTLLRMGTQMQPDLVLLEVDLPGDGVQEALGQIKNEWSDTRTIVLVDSCAQQRDVQKAGADVVLYKGFRAASLIRIVEDLLPKNVSTNSLHDPIGDYQQNCES
jgi:DNA-binding NarL/FixJ family response regulator